MTTKEYASMSREIKPILDMLKLKYLRQILAKIHSQLEFSKEI